MMCSICAPASPLESALAKNAPASPLECALTKLLDLKPPGMNSYKKGVGGTPVSLPFESCFLSVSAEFSVLPTLKIFASRDDFYSSLRFLCALCVSALSFPFCCVWLRPCRAVCSVRSVPGACPGPAGEFSAVNSLFPLGVCARTAARELLGARGGAIMTCDHTRPRRAACGRGNHGPERCVD